MPSYVNVFQCNFLITPNISLCCLPHYGVCCLIHVHGRGWLLNALASYSLGPGFKPRPGDRLSWLSFLWFYAVLPRKCWDGALKVGHDIFLPYPFHFVIHLSTLHSTLRILSHWKTSLNKLETNVPCFARIVCALFWPYNWIVLSLYFQPTLLFSVCVRIISVYVLSQ
jgi:hypothetical protein